MPARDDHDTDVEVLPAKVDGTPVPELRVDMTLRNNRLYHLRTQSGLSRHALSLDAGISPTEYGRLEALKSSPRGKRVPWKRAARALARYWGVAEEYLFPEAVEEIERTRASVEVSVGDLPQVLALRSPTSAEQESPEDLVVTGDLRTHMARALTRLSPRHAHVIRLRYGLEDGREWTGQEVAQVMGICGGRVNQIEHEALRKLRHPAVGRDLHDFDEESASRDETSWVWGRPLSRWTTQNPAFAAHVRQAAAATKIPEPHVEAAFRSSEGLYVAAVEHLTRGAHRALRGMISRGLARIRRAAEETESCSS